MRILTTAFVAQLMFATSALGQVTTEERPRGNDRQVNEAGEGQNLDQQIAACLLLGNQEEVALAEFAEEHLQHDQVKAFAKMLAEQHAKVVAKIQDAAPEVAMLKLVDSRSSAIGDNPSNRADQTGSDKGLALLQKVKSECLQLTQKELAEHKGADFDKAYVGQQIGAHLGMLAQLRGSMSFASPELQKVIAEGEKMTVMHLTEAKKLMAQIKDTGSTTTEAARPTTPKR